MALEIAIREAEDTVIVDLAGDLVPPDCVDLHAEVKRLLHRGARRVALNLYEVQSIDQYGLGALAACSVSALREFATLALVSPNHEIAEAVERGGLNKVMETFSSETKLLGSRVKAIHPLRQEGVQFVVLLRQTVCVVVWFLLALVLLIMIVEAIHPPVLENQAWLRDMRAAMLWPVDGGSTAVVFFYLIVLLGLFSIILIALDTHLQKLRHFLLGKR